MVFFTSDLHIGHRNINTYRTEFTTSEEHDEYMISKIEGLSKRDVLIVVGDFLFDCDKYNEYIERLREVKCRIKLVMGNHDSIELYKENSLMTQGKTSIEVQLPLFSYKNMWIQHCPIHPKEMRGRKGNVHGHLHKETLNDPMYFNVNIDCNDYEFVALDTIKEFFDKQPN